MFKRVLKIAAVLACSAGLFSGCTNSLVEAGSSADLGAGRAGSGDSGDRIYATATSTPKDRLQFKLKLDSKISSGTEFTFYITYNKNNVFPEGTTLTVRDGASDPYTKWTTTLGSFISGTGDNAKDGWYPVTVKAKNSTKEIGFTLNGNFLEGSVIAIKNISIAQSFSESSWSTFATDTSMKFTKSKPAEFKTDPAASSGNPGTSDPEPEPPAPPVTNEKIQYVGFRYSDYGVRGDRKYTKNYPYDEPTPAYWKDTYISKFVNKIPGTNGMFIFIVGAVHKNEDGEENRAVHLRFNNPDSSKFKETKNLKFTGSDKTKLNDGNKKTNEEICKNFLDMCEANGYKVWLQVEPGYNDLVTLADIVMTKFKNYSCVQGFGIDLEWWYRYTTVVKKSGDKTKTKTDDGRPINADELDLVIDKVLTHGSRYTVFIKHFSTAWLPHKLGTTYVSSDGTYHQEKGEPSLDDMRNKKKVILVNDNQQVGDLSTMKSIFMSWIDDFPGTDMIFQIGYYEDQALWEDDPMGIVTKLGDWAAKKSNRGKISIVWVDFSMHEIEKKLK